jgi:CSLREA domain-containing protein
MKRAALLGIAIAAALLAPSAQAATIKPNVLTDELADNGNCTLREAVQAATLNAPVDDCPKGQKRKPDVIYLAAGNYALASGDDDDNTHGDLDIGGGGRLDVIGKGSAGTTIAAPSGNRVLDLFPDSGNGQTNVRVKKLTLDGGDGGEWGGAVYARGGVESALALDRVRVANGQAQFGGGIYITGGKLRIKRSVFANNNAEANSTGFPGVHAVGGAIGVITLASSVRIEDTSFTNNNAHINDSTAEGGAIAMKSGGEIVVRRSYFELNDAYSATADASSSRHGGAIFQSSGELRVVNSTFSTNRAFGTGANARGGVYYGSNGSAEFTNSTFLENGATSGSAFALEDGSLELSRSIFGPSSSSAPCAVAGGDFESEGYNVAPDPFGCDLDGSKDKLADPHLADAPAFNGGLTKTVKLLKGSPAIDRVPVKKCKPAEGEDQRRYRRPAGKGCDSGAYERGAKAH